MLQLDTNVCIQIHSNPQFICKQLLLDSTVYLCKVIEAILVYIASQDITHWRGDISYFTIVISHCVMSRSLTSLYISKIMSLVSAFINTIVM